MGLVKRKLKRENKDISIEDSGQQQFEGNLLYKYIYIYIIYIYIYI